MSPHISAAVLNEPSPRFACSAEAKQSVAPEILAKLNHDLRTPLNAIIGFSELLLLGLAGPLTAKQRGYIRNIRRSGLVMLSEVQNLKKVPISSL